MFFFFIEMSCRIKPSLRAFQALQLNVLNHKLKAHLKDTHKQTHTHSVRAFR